MSDLAYLREFARLDLERRARTGVPEVIFGEGKSLDQLVSISHEMVARSGRAILSKLSPATLAHLIASVDRSIQVDSHANNTLAVLSKPDAPIIHRGGVIGVLAAGTADFPIADEARIMAHEMGCDVLFHCDIGIAGMHRLVEPIEELVERNVAAVVVIAGMEGALPTVVKSLIPAPVIGVPTSVGYGSGRGGHVALMAMLNSCALGVTVMNIDNGLGGGATAALIANRCARTLQDKT